MGIEIIAAIIAIVGTWASWAARGLWETKQEIERDHVQKELYAKMYKQFKDDTDESVAMIQSNIVPLRDEIRELRMENKQIIDSAHEIEKAVLKIHHRINIIEVRQQGKSDLLKPKN